MLSKAVFGGGCFWCTQTIFKRLKGVQKVQPGYAGGHLQNPTYKQVCAETTGHAEVIQILYNSQIISYRDLLHVFFSIHNPTTLNQQGGDIGSRYRSTIMFETQNQRNTAHAVIEEISKQGKYQGVPNKIVTEVVPLKVFYPAEEYHHNYFNLNPKQEYCQAVIAPKVLKFEKKFKEDLCK